MLVTLDFETYFDADYTLKKLSTSEYIRDPRFEAINCSILVDDGTPLVAWGKDEIQLALDEIDWTDAELLAHHCHFEGLILSHHFGVRPRVYRDTLSMARGVFPKDKSNKLESLAERLEVANKLKMPDFKGKRLAEFSPELRTDVSAYVVGDVLACYQSYQKLLPMLPATELPVIDMTVRMFADPVMMLDVPRTQAELDRERTEKARLVEAAGTTPEVLQSSPKLTAALEALGVTVPMKWSVKQEKMVPAMAQTDLEFAALQRHSDPRVAAIVKARLAVKSTQAETRAVRLLKAGDGQQLPVYLNYCAAISTRFSGADKLNFQNFTRGSELRKCLMAPPGQKIVIVDSSQIQTRLLGWMAGEGWLLDEYAQDKPDVYSRWGTMAFGKVVKKGDLERDLAKACVLALGFGAGAKQLQQMIAWGTYCEAMDLPLEQCQGYVNFYRTSSRQIVRLWYALQDAIGDIARGREGSLKCISWDANGVKVPSGLTMRYPHCRATFVDMRLGPMFGNRVEERVVNASYIDVDGKKNFYGGMLCADVMQGLERSIVAAAAAEIAKRYRVIMMSHDEVAYLANDDEAQEALEFGYAVMRKRPDWAQDLPLNAEGGFAQYYSK